MTLGGAIATVAAGAATIFGALILYAFRRPSAGVLHAMLGSAGGVMLGAVSFSLLLPALDGAGRGESAWLVCAFVIGALGTWGLQRVLPHDADDADGAADDGGAGGGRIGGAERRITLLVAAMALHNIPEGLAVGVGVGNDPDGAGLALAGGILVQNIPEGLAVAVAVAAFGASTRRAVLLSSATGVVEVAAGLLGLVLASLSEAILPTFLAAAAGAMLFVVVHEIGPETSRSGNRNTATLTLILGFAAMVLLDAFVA